MLLVLLWQGFILPASCSRLYRPRRAQISPLYWLVENCYEEVKGQWEERFERRYGFWRGAVEEAVYALVTP